MKIQQILLLTLISIGFISCNMTGGANYTPQISMSSRLRVFKADTLLRIDTLDIYNTNVAGVLLLDTISVGDTVDIPVSFDGITNNITAIYIIQSADSLTSIALPAKSTLDPLFSASSNYAEGKFYANVNFTSLYFPFRYIAKKPSNDAKLSFTVVSDAIFKDLSGSNTNSFVLKTPIKASK